MELAYRSFEAFSQEEFAAWLEGVPPDDRHHYELLDGYIVREPPAGWPHGEIEARIVGWLRQAVASAGRIFGSSQGFELPTGDTVEPDISFVSNERWDDAGRPSSGFPRVPPDLIVEILSPSTRMIDQGPKKRAYARAGVLEYWLVDPTSRSVVRLTFDAKRGECAVTFAESEVVRSEVLPGLSIRVAEIFPEP